MNKKSLLSASVAAVSLFSVGGANAGVWDLTGQTAVTAKVYEKSIVATARCDGGWCQEDYASTPKQGWDILTTDIKISGWKPKGVNLQVHADIECGTIFSSKDYLDLVSYNHNAGIVKMKPVLVKTHDAWGRPVYPQVAYDIGTYGEPNKQDDGTVIACKSVSYSADLDLAPELIEKDYDKAMGTHGFTWVTSTPVEPGTYQVKLVAALQAEALNCSLPFSGKASSKAFVRKRIMTVESINVGDKINGALKRWYGPWKR